MFDLRLIHGVLLGEFADQIHRVQQLAYSQEAKLIGAKKFPPLDRVVHDILQSPECFICAFKIDELVGVLSFTVQTDLKEVNISSLVVLPLHQRKGIARSLLLDAINRSGGSRVTVQTAEKNTPALNLYNQFRFNEFERFRTPNEAISIVKLERVSD
jgi:ribosomal protein S18 acetylase RimI-like enzyme